ncbi:hypothetical protein ACCP91_18680 [Xanthomonas axonopodis pv. cyamopsidis]|uniref:hypothetical protein n=1 Tax=Xanthomonas axonopodis TaxID=53413 RepID=UPI003555CDDE
MAHLARAPAASAACSSRDITGMDAAGSATRRCAIAPTSGAIFHFKSTCFVASSKSACAYLARRRAIGSTHAFRAFVLHADDNQATIA